MAAQIEDPEPSKERTSPNLQNLRAVVEQNRDAEPVNVSTVTARRHIGPQLRRWVKQGHLDEDIVAMFGSEEPRLILDMLAEARADERRARRKRRARAKLRKAAEPPTDTKAATTAPVSSTLSLVVASTPKPSKLEQPAAVAGTPFRRNRGID